MNPPIWMAYASYWFLAATGLALWYVDIRSFFGRRRFVRQLAAEPRDITQAAYRHFTSLATYAAAIQESDGAVRAHADRMHDLDPDEARQLLALALVYVNRKDMQREARLCERALLAERES